MFARLLRQRLSGILELSDTQIQVLEAHYRLLMQWNPVLNLTSLDSLEEIVERHYAESLFLAAHLPTHPLRIADIGSGAGFPGIPVAVVRADCSVTLIESHRRKAVFLREATRQISNVRVLARRAPDIPEQFDCAISRAVSYRELAPIMKKLADSVDLLTGEEGPPADFGFRWRAPIRIPWSRNGFLRISVSRET